MDITIKKQENGYLLTFWTNDIMRPALVYQGLDVETIDEMLAQVKLILLEEPEEETRPDNTQTGLHF